MNVTDTEIKMNSCERILEYINKEDLEKDWGYNIYNEYKWILYK